MKTKKMPVGAMKPMDNEMKPGGKKMPMKHIGKFGKKK